MRERNAPGIAQQPRLPAPAAGLREEAAECGPVPPTGRRTVDLGVCRMSVRVDRAHRRTQAVSMRDDGVVPPEVAGHQQRRRPTTACPMDHPLASRLPHPTRMPTMHVSSSVSDLL